MHAIHLISGLLEFAYKVIVELKKIKKAPSPNQKQKEKELPKQKRLHY
jgi:hypothetical protein